VVSGEGVSLSRRVVVLGALGLFVLGLATKTLFFSASGSQAHPARRVSSVAAGPSRTDPVGVAAGVVRSHAGARAAAVAYVGLGNLVLGLDPDQGAEVLRLVASRGAGDQFVQSELAGFAQLRDALGRGSGPTRLRVGVLATALDAYSSRRARVRLWRVAVLSREGMSNPGAQWATVTYDLVWEAGDWKIWSETVAAGPSPVSTDSRAATPAELEATLAGFVAYPGGG